MQIMHQTGPTELVVLGIAPGEMLLESITEAIERRGIRNGVVISGIGTLKTAHMHYIKDTEFPPTNEFFRLEEPLELVSLSGIIADGEPHLHVAVSRGQDQVWSGHLEGESEVAYLAEIAILVCNDLDMARREDPQRHIKLLGGKG